MATNDPHFKIRMPRDLKLRLEASAEEQGRSLTAEIVHRLEHSFDTVFDLMLLNRAAELKQAERDVASARMQLEDAVDDPEIGEEIVEARKHILAVQIQMYERIKLSLDSITAEKRASVLADARTAAKPIRSK